MNPQIIAQRNFEIIYTIPSTSRPGLEHKHIARAFKNDLCECEALQFKHKTYECVHFRMVTLKGPVHLNFSRLFEEVWKKRGRPLHEAWQYMSCMMPDRYDTSLIYCQKCPLYPATCNIRLIHHKRNTIPLVWRLKSALASRHRSKARKLLNRIHKNFIYAQNIREVILPTAKRPISERKA